MTFFFFKISSTSNVLAILPCSDFLKMEGVLPILSLSTICIISEELIWPLGGVGEKRIWKYTFWEFFICKFKDAQIFYSMGANFFRTEHWRFQNILSMFFSFSRNKSKKFEKVEICSLKFAWFDNYFGFFLSSLVAVRK